MIAKTNAVLMTFFIACKRTRDLRGGFISVIFVRERSDVSARP